MQIHIIDYLRNMFALQEDKKKAEDDLRHKDEQIDMLSIESNTDALTGVGNKTAYIKKMDELNRKMRESDIYFAIVMVDINRLKHINDDYGHRSGDVYIKGCCHMVCETFKHSPVFRVGGDEFVAVLMGTDYENRMALVSQLRSDFKKTYEQEGVSPWLRYSAAVGMAENASVDSTAEFVFRRADEEMYKDKDRFKSRYGTDSR
jgi:diguanylate cyclase (GGDEF)-like protein